MLLKIGELAQRYGLTVRALRHYDAIGLLRPSGRSEGGYRLYNAADVARLQAIFALRHLDLPLNDIARMLEGGTLHLGDVVAQQIEKLDAEIARCSALRQQLVQAGERLATAEVDGDSDWLRELTRLSTMGRYFSPDELGHILRNWERDLPMWRALFVAIHAAMDAGWGPDHPEVQKLTMRWIQAAFNWMDGDRQRLARWDAMWSTEREHLHSREASAIEFIRAASDLRLSILDRHLTRAGRSRLRPLPPAHWHGLIAAVQAAIDDGVDPGSEAAQALARSWDANMSEMTAHDPELKRLFLQAIRTEPVLRASSPFNASQQAFLSAARASMLASGNQAGEAAATADRLTVRPEHGI